MSTSTDPGEEQRPTVKRTGPVVLDEDVYTENLEKIIVRDFFPDLLRMKATFRTEFGLGNVSASLRSEAPSRFDTPASSLGVVASERSLGGGGGESSRGGGGTSRGDSLSGEGVRITESQLDTMSLSQYLRRYTSEDMESFGELMAEDRRRHAERHSWLYKKEQQRPMIEGNPNPPGALEWRRPATNSFMFAPEEVRLSEEERVALSVQRKQTVCHANTRFETQPFPLRVETKAPTFNGMEGKIGVDGKEILPCRTPTVGGYNFLGMPSVSPGVEMSPLMTWGDIEGTPLGLGGGGATPKSVGPSFRVPETPKRDLVLHRLTEKISKTNRAKKQEALKQAVATFANTPGTSRIARLHSMSPAAQRLLEKTVRPGSASPFDKVLTPTAVRSRGHLPTPKSSREPDRTTTLSTDGLLNLPAKKTRALDFF